MSTIPDGWEELRDYPADRVSQAELAELLDAPELHPNRRQQRQTQTATSKEDQ